jgi:thioredoxin-like negative regulator of GroEL
MHRPHLVALLAGACILSACGGGEPDDLCKRFFKPYPDLRSATRADGGNGAYVEAMALYRNGDFQAAGQALKDYVGRKAPQKDAYLYLANCELANGHPYEAELALDKLEQSNLRGFADQAEWYTVLCWLCSGQRDRARAGAEAIASRRQTYRSEAAELAKALD